jgi:hypothetical protein
MPCLGGDGDRQGKKRATESGDMTGSLASKRRPGKTPTVEWLIAAACIFLTLLPLAVFRYFPNQDGPAHVNAALTLAKLHAGAPFPAAYFMDTGFTLTNWAATVILSLLRHVVEPAQLESAFVALYAALMMAAAFLAVRFLLRAPLGYALLFFPLIFSHMLHMGSFNLVLAYVLFLPLLGLYHRYLQRPSGSCAAFIGLVLALIFALHAEIALLALGCAGIYAVWILSFAFFGKSGFLRSPALRGAGAGLRPLDGLWLVIASLPVPVLSGAYYLLNHGVETSHPFYAGLVVKFAHLVFLSGIASYSVFGMGAAALMFAVIAAGTGFALRRIVCPIRVTRDECMLACALFLLAMFFAMPDGLGNVFNLEERLMIPMLLALLGWLVLKLSPRVSARAAALIGLAFVALQTTDRMNGFAQINRDLKEYTEATAAIPERSAIIVMDLDHIADHPLPRDLARPFEAVTRFDPELHFMGTALGDRDVALVSNFEAFWAFPYFALKHRKWLSAILGSEDLDLLALNEAAPDAFQDVITGLKTGAAPVSYLALWARDPASLDDPKTRTILAAATRDYDKIFTSSRAHMTLYRMK